MRLWTQDQGARSGMEPLVDRQTRIHAYRPAVNATSEIVDADKALMFQELTDLRTSTPMVTDHHDFGFAINLVEATGDASHRHVQRRFYAADFPFPGFAHIDQERTAA